MCKMDKRVALELIKTRKAVRQKVASLKADIEKSQFEVEQKLQPIARPLRDLMATIKLERTEPKLELPYFKQSPKGTPPIDSKRKRLSKGTPSTGSKRTINSTQLEPSFLDIDVIAETVDGENDENGQQLSFTDLNVDEMEGDISKLVSPAAFQEYLDFYEGLARQYVEEMITDTKDAFDHQYGVRYDPATTTFEIGDSKLDFKGQDIIIDDKFEYKGTPGLYELLFKKTPIGYKKEDERNYQDIIKRTNAHKRRYDPESRISGNRGDKYTKIIKPLMNTNSSQLFQRPTPPLTRPRSSSITLSPRPRATALVSRVTPPTTRARAGSTASASKRGTGAQALELNNKRLEFVPWKNPNTLVDRLKVLVASQMAGHTGHNNEIIHIIEELKQAKIIV